MAECINVYLATQPVARSLLSCGVRLFVTLMYRNGQKNTVFTIKLFHRLMAPSF